MTYIKDGTWRYLCDHCNQRTGFWAWLFNRSKTSRYCNACWNWDHRGLLKVQCKHCYNKYTRRSIYPTDQLVCCNTLLEFKR